MGGDVVVAIGRRLASGEKVTPDVLQEVLDSITASILEGTLTARELADGSIPASKLDAAVQSQLGLPDGAVTLAKLADGVLAASAAGRLKMADGFVTTAKIGANQVTAAKLAASLVWPVGLIVPYAGETVPTGWFECAGTAVSRVTYASLFTAIGTLWGVGDGSTTFNVPDLRGYFLRGWDNGAGNDPDSASRTGGDHVGSVQADAVKAHTHTLQGYNCTVAAGTAYYVMQATGGYQFTSQSTGGSETRPKNKNAMFIIKY